MKEGAKIGAVQNKAAVQDRMRISSVQVLSRNEAKRRGYQTAWPALVPQTQARELTPTEIDAYTTGSAASRLHLIFLEIGKNGLAAINSQFTTPPRIFGYGEGPLVELLPGIEAHLEKTGPNHALANKLTSSTILYEVNNQAKGDPDMREGLRGAIHFDRMNDYPVHNRVNDSRRIVVNLGDNPRYSLLVVPNTIIGEADLAFPGDKDYIPRVKTLTPYVAEHAADLRVIWTLLNPGDGYVVPAHLVYHDGSTYKKGRSMTAVLNEPTERWDPATLAKYSLFN